MSTPSRKSLRRRVLMIDYLFPPLAGPGIQRTLGYVRHLRQYGWDPIVLTVHDGDHSLYDPTLLMRIPQDIVVLRTPSIEPVRFIRRILRWILAFRSPGEGTASTSGRPLWQGGAWVKRLEKWVLFPDRRIGWLPFAVRRALCVQRSTPFDIIYSTSTNIVTGHLIAYWAARRLRIPWVADFQDDWLAEYVSIFPTTLHRRLGQTLERLIVHAATRITVATEPHRQLMEARYPTLRPEKIAVIPMGFDPELFEGVTHSRPGAFTITHLGSFYSTRSPAAFLRALGRFLRRHPEWDGRIDVRFIGTFDAENLRQTESILDAYGLRSVVRLLGVLPYPHALAHLLSSEILLLVTDDGLWGRKLLASKLLEYLAARRPILALVPPGATADIVERARAGLVVRPFDEQAIESALTSLVTAWAEGRLAFNADTGYIAQFSWPLITGAFVGILQACLEGAAPMDAVFKEFPALPSRGG